VRDAQPLWINRHPFADLGLTKGRVPRGQLNCTQSQA
jgi:hypothetical protein